MRHCFLRCSVIASVLFVTSTVLADQTIAPATKEAARKTIVADTFDNEKSEVRNAARGDWKVADGIISVTQDDELYAKYKNHGPLLIYNHDFTNGTASMRFRGRHNQAVVFTMDGETGHVVRLKMTPGKPTVVLAWPKGAKKPKVLARDLPAIDDNQWTDLIVAVHDDEAKVSVNGTEHSLRYVGINRPKTNAKLGFSFGSIEIDSFSLDEPRE